jgi:hypothetical protein
MTKMDKLEYAKEAQKRYGDKTRCTWVEVGEYIALLEEVKKLRAERDELLFADDLLEERQRERDHQSEVYFARYGF